MPLPVLSIAVTYISTIKGLLRSMEHVETIQRDSEEKFNVIKFPLIINKQ